MEFIGDVFAGVMIFISIYLGAGLSALLLEAAIYHAARLLYGTTLSEDFREKARENLWATMCWVWMIGAAVVGWRQQEPLILVPLGLIALATLVAVPFIIRSKRTHAAARRAAQGSSVA